MLTKRSYNTVTWIDLESPSKSEVRQIMAEYALHPLVANELLTPSLRDRIDAFPGYLYVILHFPSTHTHGESREQEVDFIIGKNFLISAHYRSIDSVAEFAKLFEIEGMLEPAKKLGGGLVFYYLLRTFYETLARDVDTIENDLKTIGERIFSAEGSALVREITDVEHTLLEFNHVVRPHRGIFESLEFERSSKIFFGTDAQRYMSSIASEYARIQLVLESAREMTTSLRETNSALLSTRTNDIMKRLTIMSFIVMPMTFISSIFQMSSPYLPFINKPYGPYAIFAIMLLSAAFTFAYFKRKGWI